MADLVRLVFLVLKKSLPEDRALEAGRTGSASAPVARVQRHRHVAHAGVLVAARPLHRAGELDARRQRSSSASSTTRISRRASAAPRQKWLPWPKARCGLGSRRTSKRNGSANTASSRLADAHHSVTLSPARMVWPRELDVARRGAAVVGGGRRPAQDLLDRRRQQRAVGPQRPPLLGVLDQRQDADGDRVARRLAAGGDEQVEEHLQLEVGERLGVAVVALEACRARPRDSRSSPGARRFSRDQRGRRTRTSPRRRPRVRPRSAAERRGRRSRASRWPRRTAGGGPPAARRAARRSPAAAARRRRRRGSRTSPRATAASTIAARARAQLVLEPRAARAARPRA